MVTSSLKQSTLARAATRATNWLKDRPTIALPIALVLLVLSSASLLVATGRSSIEGIVLWTVIGSAAGSSGLLILSIQLQRWLEGSHERRRKAARLGALLGLLGLSLVIVAIQITSSAVATAGIALAIMGLLPFNQRLADEGLRQPNVWTIGGATAAAIGPTLAAGNTSVNTVFVVATGLWFVGLVALKVGLGPLIDMAEDSPRTARGAALAGLSIATVGVGVGWLASISTRPTLLLVGGLIVITGLSVSGIATTRLLLDARRGRVLMVLGAGLAAFSFALGLATLHDVGITITATVVVASIGAWFVLRGEGFVALALIGFVVAWVLVDRTTDLQPLPGDDNHPAALIVLGDSFISGEGAANFLPGTNHPGPQRNECRRSRDAYGPRLASELSMDLVFLACSGAVSDNLLDTGQMVTSPADNPGALPQLAELERQLAMDDVEPALILVSIGGNDVGFADIVKACLLPGNCAELDELWLAYAEDIGPRLIDTYRAIAATAPGTPIVVVPYPIVVGAAACGLALDGEEHRFIVEFTETLNRTITDSAAAAGVHASTASPRAFNRFQLCDRSPATNFLHLAPTEGPFKDRLRPANWIHGSMHPNETGHALLAAVLLPELRTILAGQEAAEIAVPAPDLPQSPTPIEDLPSVEAPQDVEVRLDAREQTALWIDDVLDETARQVAFASLLLLTGGWLIAFGLLSQPWSLVDLLRPR